MPSLVDLLLVHAVTGWGARFIPPSASLPLAPLPPVKHRSEPKPPGGSSAGASKWPLAALVSGWHTYFAQSTLLAGLALALLYLSVLSLGFLMTAFLKYGGMTEVALSGFRAAGALSGLLAPAIFPPLSERLGLKLTGAAGISWQVCWLWV